MDSLEPTTVEALIRRHAPELIPQSDWEFRSVAAIAYALLTGTVTLAILAGLGVPALLLLPVSGVAGFAVAAGSAWWMDRKHQADLRRFAIQLRESPWRFYEEIARRFAAEVERQRARTIGPESEWGRARLSLENAAQEADRSVAYWTRRQETDPKLAQVQLAAATRLRDKFHTALSRLDERARLLVGFFNDCEARLAVLQSTRRDYEEIRKLEALADRSDEVVTHAEVTLQSIGASFVTEAVRVGQALGGLERIGLTNLAGEVPVDQLEALADRIVESADRDRTALERVTDSI